MTHEETNRNNFARTKQDVPLFPYNTISTASDEMEQAQIDFVMQAGMPWLTDDDTNNQQTQK